jgi:hypothetical protein
MDSARGTQKKAGKGAIRQRLCEGLYKPPDAMRSPVMLLPLHIKEPLTAHEQATLKEDLQQHIAEFLVDTDYRDAIRRAAPSDTA